MIINREGKGIMGRRVQYARNYLELFDLFERNQIDVWETTDDIVRAVDAAGVESPGWQHGVTLSSIIHALRTADADGKPRLAAMVELEREHRLDYGKPTDDLPGQELAPAGYVAPDRFRPSSALTSGN